MGTLLSLAEETAQAGQTGWPDRPPQLVLVVEDQRRLMPTVSYICDFLGILVRSAGTYADLAGLLDSLTPIAVICELDGSVQDGFHVMKMVAQYDANLPIMLVTGPDQSMIGAAEAVEEIWKLSSVLKLRERPGLGDVVDFLFRSGKMSGTASVVAGA